MAVKQLDLVINTTRAEQNLKKIQQLAKQVESEFQQKINKIKINVRIDPAQKALEKLNAQIKEGQDLINKFNQGAGLTAFGAKISTVTEQVGLIKKAFNEATTATERQRAATAILAGDFKKLTMEATAFANATDKRRNKGLILGNVGETIKEIEKFPKTILAGKNAMSMLNSMLEVVNVNSQEFKDINEAIGRQLEKNAEIQNKINSLNGSSKQQQADKKKQERLKKQEGTKKRIKALNEQTLNIENRIKNSIISQAKKEELTNNLKRVGVEIDRKELDLAKQINIETQRNLAMEEKLQSRKNKVIQSALIGGGFPLLFGGGPLQSIAGGLGGGIGEAVSPGGGFAGSIAATAAISKIQEFANNAREVGNALKDANLGLEKLEELGIKVDDVTKQQVETLLELGKVREAENLVNQQFAEIIGPQAVLNLQDLDTAFDELQQQTSSLFLKLSADLAPEITTIINLVTQLSKILQALPIKDIIANFSIGFKLNKFIGDVANKVKPKNLSSDLSTGQTKIDSTDSNSKSSAKAEESKLDALVKQTLQYDAIVMFGTKEAEIRKQIKEFEEQATEQEKIQIATGKINVRQLIEQNNEAKKLADNAAIIEDSFKRLSDTITQDIGNGIKGLIQGTQSLNDVLRNVTNKIADAFLNMAIFGNFGGGSVTGGLLGAIGFANGGRPPVGKASIVGERGPELFVPDRAGTIIPNNAMGGAMNVVVNVDASGSSVEGDEQQANAFGSAIATAIQSELIKQKRPGGLLA